MPPKVGFFAWEVWWGKVLTMEQLKKRGFRCINRCPHCCKAKENLEHSLVHCPSIWGFQAAIISIPRMDWVCPYSVKDLLLGWSSFLIRKNARKPWMAAPLSLLWAIWKERNRIVFEEAFFSPNRLKLSFFSFLISWAGLITNVDHSIVRIILCIL